MIDGGGWVVRFCDQVRICDQWLAGVVGLVGCGYGEHVDVDACACVWVGGDVCGDDGGGGGRPLLATAGE